MSAYPVLMHTALDATDCHSLAVFYRQFLGLRYRPGDEAPADGSDDDPGWLVLLDPAGHRVFAFQQVPALDSEPLYVLADPAGHPFCLLVGSDE